MSRIHSAPQRLTTSNFFWIGLLVAIVGSSFWGGRRLRSISGIETHPITAAVALDADHQQTRAKVLYQSLCAACHGSEGMGDGPASLTRPPRAFPQTDWRSPKTAESVRRVIADGISDAMMPGFRQTVSETEIALLADHVLRLAETKTLGLSQQSLNLAIEAAGFDAIAPRPVPAMSIQTTDGRQTTLDELRGKVVLLHFWGTACVHCLAEFASLGELDADGAIEILSICTDESDPQAVESAGRPFAGEHRLFVDGSGLAAHRFQVQALPAYFLIDPQGRIVATRTGTGQWSVGEMRNLVTLLAGPDLR